MLKKFFSKKNTKIILLSIFSFLFILNINFVNAQITSSCPPGMVADSGGFGCKTPSSANQSNISANIPNFSDVGSIITNFNKNIVQNLVVLLSGLALVLFLWGLVRFIYDRSRGNEKSLEQDKKGMMWGLGALFVLVSVWGIIKLFQSFIGVSSNNDINLPKICIDGNCNTTTSNTPAQSGVTGGTFNDQTTAPATKLATTFTGDYTTNSVSNWSLIMKEGSSGQQVAELQKFLKDNGTAPTLNIDGNYGPATTDAVKAFQTASKLVPDGMIGYATRAVILYRYLKATPPASIYNITGWPDLTLGSTGAAVGQLQQVLNNRSCYPSNVNNDIDQNFGIGTKAAVDNFQKKNSLREDTIVGPSTRAVLAADDTYSC